MGYPQTRDDDELEFFGVRLKGDNPRLAALLHSDVTGEVEVVGRRTREVLAGADDSRAERDVAELMLHADPPVTLRASKPED
jgi:hypothetical protein